jgi:hypothetical protein
MVWCILAASYVHLVSLGWLTVKACCSCILVWWYSLEKNPKTAEFPSCQGQMDSTQLAVVERGEPICGKAQEEANRWWQIKPVEDSCFSCPKHLGIWHGLSPVESENLYDCQQHLIWGFSFEVWASAKDAQSWYRQLQAQLWSPARFQDVAAKMANKIMNLHKRGWLKHNISGI